MESRWRSPFPWTSWFIMAPYPVLHFWEWWVVPSTFQMVLHRKLNMTMKKSSVWRCISYWKWGLSNVMLVFREGICINLYRSPVGKVGVSPEEAQDGSWHSFLLKGRDDLRLDGRIMQLLRMVSRSLVELVGGKSSRLMGANIMAI